MTLVRLRLGLLEKVTPGDHVAVLVARDLVGKPVRVRFATDHDEQRGCGDPLDGAVCTIGKRYRFERPGAGAVDYLGAMANGDIWGRLDLTHEVARHRFRDAGASNEQRDRPRVFGEMQRGLPGRVACADDEYILILHGVAFAGSRAVEDA